MGRAQEHAPTTTPSSGEATPQAASGQEVEVATESLASPSPETVAALQEAGGNSMALDAAEGELATGEAEDAGQDPGAAAYEAVLGRYLGGKLYGAVHDALSFEAVQGYARSGMESGLRALVDQLKRADEVDESAVKEFADALVERYGDLAADWLDCPQGHRLQEGLQGWADAHPRTIVTLALLAAAAAVLADMEIPEIERTFEIGDDTSLALAARLGTLQHVAVQKISAKFQTVAAGITATFSGEVSQGDEGTEVSGSATLERGATSLKVDGALRGEDLTFGLSGETPIGAGTTLRGALEGDDGGVNTLSATVETEDGETVHTTDVRYDLGSQVLTLGHAAGFGLGPGRALLSGEVDTEGTTTLGAGYEGEVPGVEGLTTSLALETALQGLGVGSAYDLTAEQRAALGLDYSQGDFLAHFQLDYDSAGSTDLSTEVEGPVGENQAAGFRATLPDLDPRLLEVGAFYRFENPDRFQGFLADYTYNRAEDSHELKLRVEEELGGLYGRPSNQTVFTDAGVENEAELLGAKFVDRDVALIGGVRDRYAPGSHSVQAVVGAQVNGVPITVGYDPSSGTVEVGLTLRFGR